MLMLRNRKYLLLIVVGMAASLIAFLAVGLSGTSIADPLGPALVQPASPAPVAPAVAAPAAAPMGKSTIGDYVWHDYNLDGFHDDVGVPTYPDESEYLTGFNGVKVNLYLKDPVSGNWGLITSTLTGDNPNMPGTQTGWYEFNVTADGSHYRVEIDASNFAPGGPLYGYVNTSALTYGQGVANRIEMFLPGLVEVNLDGDFGYARAGIALVKTAGNAANGATYYINAPSAPVTYTYRYTNTGETYLTTVVITDDAGTPANPADDFTVCTIPGPVAPGASGTCLATKTLTGDRTNIAYASGTPTDSTGATFPGYTGPNPRASDDAVVDMVNPGINIVKTAGTAADGATYYINAPGASVTYYYTVTNTGDVPLINVKTRVTDDKCSPVAYVSGDANSNNILETTETWRFTCTANITADTTNTATTIGTPATSGGAALPGIPDVSDTDQAVVDMVNPKIAIAKTPDLQYVGAGTVVTFTIYVTNTGDVRLNNVSVSDAQAPNCAKANLGFLVPGASINYTCQMTPTATVTNVAVTTGTPADGSGAPLPDIPAPTAQDDAVVQVLTAGIDLVKTAGTAADGQTLVINQPAPVNVTYSFRITNTGTSYLKNIAVTDDKIGAICTIAGPLAPGASTTCTATTSVATDVTNTGTATGAPSDAAGVIVAGLPNPTDFDTARVEFRGRLGDFVWWDLNEDGIQDVGEPGIPDVVLALTGSGGLTATTVTDASGVYTFTDLPTDVYTVALSPAQFLPGEPLADWYPTTPPSGAITVSLAAGQVITTADFGLNIPTSYTLTKVLNTEPPIRTDQAISYTIRITNTGKTTIVSLPLSDTYDPTFLAYGLHAAPASPPSQDTIDDGQIDWPDLVASFGRPLEPGLGFSVVVTFTAIRPTDNEPGQTVTNTAEVHDAVAEALGLGIPAPPRIALPTGQDQAEVRIEKPTGLAVARVWLTIEDRDAVAIIWDTVNEAQILGFNIYRDDGRTSPRALNSDLIAAELAGANQGRQYRHTDRPPAAGRYSYTLEVVRLDGRTVRLPAGRVAVGE